MTTNGKTISERPEIKELIGPSTDSRALPRRWAVALLLAALGGVLGLVILWFQFEQDQTRERVDDLVDRRLEALSEELERQYEEQLRATEVNQACLGEILEAMFTLPHPRPGSPFMGSPDCPTYTPASSPVPFPSPTTTSTTRSTTTTTRRTTPTTRSRPRSTTTTTRPSTTRPPQTTTTTQCSVSVPGQCVNPPAPPSP